MALSAVPSGEPHTSAPAPGPRMRPIARGQGWRVAEYVCGAGPDDRDFEERHETFTIAAVLEGTFRYRTGTGASLMHPGAWLLGNHDECFVCGHDHSRGDRCVALHVDPVYFAEVAATSAGTGRFRFASPLLPAADRGMPLMARMHALAAQSEPLAIDEAVAGLLQTVIARMSGAQPACQRVSARDERRISAVLHHLEDRFADALDLDALAAQATMSKYHFLRTFRSVVGRSPHRYLLDLRLHHVAQRLAGSAETITHIALGCGFGDLSTFVAHFRGRFGESPSQFRARHRGTFAG